jgi:H-type small acid-soluble spore protein
MAMDNRRAEEIMQSHGVIDVNYNGMPVWLEGIRGDMAKVTFIGLDTGTDIPVKELNETGPFRTI